MELINNNTNFKLTNLKFTKYHFMSGEVYNGCPIKTSIEIKFDNYNLSTNKEITTKCIEHTYMLEHNFEKQTNFQQYELENSENIIKSLEQIDFKNLKNNYFSNDSFHRHSHWELEYNNYFKIVGTFDNEIDEIKEIKRILDFEQIERQELEKVEEKIKNTKFSISIKDAIKNFIYKMQTASDIENGLFDGTIIFDIKDEEEFTELTEELNKLYNISDNETQLHNNDDMKQFLINWLKKIEEVNKLVDEEEFKKFEDEERNNKMNKELKINNNVVFEDEETKVEFQKYLDEINEYNRKIQNGEDPGVNPADLLNKYREKFCGEELENKMKELDDKKNNFKFENNEMDELINKIDAKIAELDEKNKE